jgi:hypothetical protein
MTMKFKNPCYNEYLEKRYKLFMMGFIPPQEYAVSMMYCIAMDK